MSLISYIKIKTMGIKATYYGANGWLLEFDKIKILIDPWLKGDLTFPPGDWLIKGELTKELDIPQDINYLLLTQGQPDHSHPPTLEQINKNVPVIGSKAASKVVKRIGFKHVTTLNPGEYYKYKDLNILATSGAAVPNLENGYIIDCNLDSVYIEPHGFLDKKIKPRDLDLVISPVVDFSLPLAGKFIKGKSVLPELIKLFNPSIIFASTTGGDIKFTGLINNLITTDGAAEDISLFNNTNTDLINPIPLKKYVLD
tara:strand:+ start:368 stop:1135 length:768 start_codon:yes stop_codon:yes gene_type:complete